MRVKSLLIRLLLAALTVSPVTGTANSTIAIVVARNSEMTQADRLMTARKLRRIYRKQRILWPDGQRIQPLNLVASNPLRTAFTQALFHRSLERMEAFWNQAYFEGVSPPHVVDSQEAVLRFVSRVQGAIGYVAACRVDKRVKVIMTLESSTPLPDSLCHPDRP